MKLHSAFLFAATVVIGAWLSLGLTETQAQEKKPEPKPVVKHTDAKQAAKLVATNAVIVLDIRTPDEFADGHIAGATNIDFMAGDFAERLGRLDRQKSYLLHCGSGRRSTNSLPQFSKLGFTNLIHLDGGFSAWQAAGNPVTKK
jgi:phage shock protein E